MILDLSIIKGVDIVAQKIIKGPVDDNSLNSTNHNFTELYSGFRDTSGKINKVEKDINNRMDNFIDETSDAAFDKVVDSARLEWDTVIEKKSDLPSDAKKGKTIGVKEDGLVYRYNGIDWIEIYEINLNPITEVDGRLSSQLADTDSFRGKESAILRKKPTPMITWLDDDGQMGVYEKLYPLAQEYGIVFTSALITSRVGNREGYMDWNHVEELKDSGHFEFVSHTHAHSTALRPDQMTEEQLRDDYASTKKILKARGLNYRCVVYPFATYREREVEIAKEYFDYAVGTATRGNRIVTGKFDNYDLGRTNGQGYEWLDVVKTQIDKAVNENAWLLLTTHVDQGGWWDESYAREVIEYVLSKGVKFVTTEEGINAHGNIAQFNGNVISAKGEIFGSELGISRVDNNTSITGNTSIDYFKKGAITYSRISGNRGGFPSNDSGILETHRIFESETNLWEYQIFITTRSKRIYYRKLDEETREWQDWVLQGMTQHLPTNSVTTNMLPTHDILKNKITYSAVNTSGHSTFPRQKSGMLITYAQQTDSFAYQEYHIFRSGDVYKRWFDSSNNKWLSWRPAGNTIVLDFNEYNSDNKIEDFDFGITVFSCNSANGGSNLPNDTGGTFTTYYTHKTELAWNYQEFKEYGTTNKYIRSARLNGDWSPWSQL